MHQFRNENADFGGNFFGAIGVNHSSTNSLPSIPSGHPRTQSTNQFHQFTMDQEQFQQQQRHLQQHPFGRHSQQFQPMGTSNNFGGGTSNGPFHQQQLNGMMTGAPQQQSPSSSYSNRVNPNPSIYHYAQQNDRNQFNPTANSSFLQFQEQQSGQRHHYFGGMPHQSNLYQDHQQYINKDGDHINNGSMLFSPQDAEQQQNHWLPVPPGFEAHTTTK
jgi:hypothetical protein